MNKKGSLANENIIMFVLFFFIFLGFAYYSFNALSFSYGDNQITGALTGIKNSADTMHELGVGNKETLRIDFPSGIQSSLLSGKTATIISAKGEVHEEIFDYQIVGQLPKEEGTYYLPITSITGRIVRIGNGPYISYITERCFSKRPTMPLLAIGGELSNTILYVQAPNMLGGMIEPYPTSHYTIVDDQTIDITADTGLTYTSSPTLIFKAHPWNDPFYFFVEDSNGVQSNKVDFYVKLDCSGVPPL
jgi:hypothetical protein